MKKYAGLFFALLTALILCLSVTTAHAATPEDMTQPEVAERLDLLVEQLGNKYFTTNQKAAPSNGAASCGMVNVVEKSWLKTATDGMIPASLYTSGTFVHYYNGTTLTRGYSCCGFANYAQWYLFAQDSKDIVKTKEIAFVKFNKSNMLKYAQPGDVIRLGDSSSGGGEHSAVVYSINDTTVTVVDSNWTTGTDKCKVTKHTIKYTSYNYVGITRAKNYEYPTGWYTIDDSDGLRHRDGPSPDYAQLQLVPDGAKVRVIDTDGFWGKYEYNGIVGWSNMDYMAFKNTYVDTVTFDAGGGDGTIDPIYFDVGTGFHAPVCTFVRPCYRFTGWTLEHEDLGKWRCVSADGSTYEWLTEEEAAAKGYTKYLYAEEQVYNRSARIDKGASYRMHANWEYVGCEAPAVKVSNHASTGKVVLSWSAVEGSSKYELYRSTSLNGTYTKIWTANKTSVTHNGTPGTTYYYKVRALDNIDNTPGAFSAIVQRTCDYAKPVVKATNNTTTGKVILSWDAVKGASKYELYRSTSLNGTYTKIWAANKTSVTHNGAPGTTYYYKVRALGDNTNATSAFSAIVQRTCDYAKPVVTVTLSSAGKPVLTWDAVNNATKYEVYRATSEDGMYTRIWASSATVCTHNSAVSGTTYYYKVRAVGTNANAASAYSSVKFITAE